MEKNINFLIEAGKLKKILRSGFLWLGVKNPETIAQHIFRVAVLNWILALKNKPSLNLEKIIKISLVHDLCEVYAGDMSPYWGLLPKNKKKRKEILKRWIRLPQKIKEKRAKIKFKKEKEALQKLVKHLSPELKSEIMGCWFDYEGMKSREGVFVKQGDKVETLIQAIEYWGTVPDSPVVGWWEEIEEAVDNPALSAFLGRIEQRFYRNNKKINGDIDFLLKIGKLKGMVRKGWTLREVKNGSTVAEDAFFLAITVWILNKRKKLNLEKMLKMSLVYEICEVYAEDKTPYEEILPNKKSERKKILERWPRFSKNVKIKRFAKDYKEEKKSLSLLTSGLSKNLREEIIYLWDNCKKRKSPEGNFVNQIYWVTMTMQALEYWKKNNDFPILGWIEQMAEFIDDPIALDFLNILYKKYRLVEKI